MAMITRVLVLGRESRASQLLVNYLRGNGVTVFFIEERRDDRLKLIRKRVKRLGVFRVLSQLIFQLFQRVLTVFSHKRIEGLIGDYKDRLVPDACFPDINAKSAICTISTYDVDLILLSGTRLLSREFLRLVETPIINVHAGITPMYRGVHGGYWSIVELGDFSEFGATIHVVDEGVDTGVVLKYAYASPGPEDNFVTFPILQQKAACFELVRLIKDDILFESREAKPHSLSRIWSHPTIFEYLANGVRKGVW